MDNDLKTLTAGVFSELRVLYSLFLSGNPGSGTFLPTADAGADRAVEAGQTLTLRARVSSTDPWGDNVDYAWRQTDSNGHAMDLGGADGASISFVVPAASSRT